MSKKKNQEKIFIAIRSEWFEDRISEYYTEDVSVVASNDLNKIKAFAEKDAKRYIYDFKWVWADDVRGEYYGYKVIDYRCWKGVRYSVKEIKML